MHPGFKRDELQPRYDVTSFQEDAWHTYSGEKTSQILERYLANIKNVPSWLLNAGGGIYEVNAEGWKEVSADLFLNPLRHKERAVCANIERLPFQDGCFGAVVCVGEVLAYCDPAKAIREFSRVLAPSGTLICDFGSSRSSRFWFKTNYGNSADIVIDIYNGTKERTWVYDPMYIENLLVSSKFIVKKQIGTHDWSAIAKRFGASISTALTVQKKLQWLRLPSVCADLTTIVAAKGEA